MQRRPLRPRKQSNYAPVSVRERHSADTPFLAMYQESTPFFDMMPLELVTLIFRLLPEQTLIIMERVCSLFRRAAASLWSVEDYLRLIGSAGAK